MATITLTVDAESRNLLIDEGAFTTGDLGDFESCIVNGERSEALRLLEAAKFAMEMREQLGWEPLDPARPVDGDAFQVTVDEEKFRRWLIDRRAEWAAEIGDDVVRLAAQKRGEAEHYYADSQEESIAITRRQIDQAREKIECIIGLIRQMPAAVA